MVAKPGTIYQYAARERQYEYRNGTSYTSSTTYDTLPKVTDSLVQFASTRGDYKTPNSHLFERVYHNYMFGVRSEKRVFSGGYELLTYEGTQGYPVTGVPSYDEGLKTEAYNKVLSEFYDNLRGQIDLSVDIAQAGQVAAMVKNTFKIVSYVRRHPVKALRSAYHDFLLNPKALGGKWLEFQYGWRPLAQTVFNCARNVMDGTPSFAVLRTRGKSFKAKNLNSGSGTRYVTEVKDWARCEICGHFKLKQNMAQQLAQYTSLNPASVVWELTPYSFVVDWVYNVGGYIRNLESALLYATLWDTGYVTFGQKQEARQQELRDEVVGSYTYHTANEGFRRMTKGSRTVLSSSPLPRPAQFKCDLGSGRLLNAAALLSQHLNSFDKRK